MKCIKWSSKTVLVVLSSADLLYLFHRCKRIIPTLWLDQRAGRVAWPAASRAIWRSPPALPSKAASSQWPGSHDPFITAAQHPTERILKRIRQWSKAYKTMFLLVCCSLLILHEGDTFLNGLWSKSAPSQEALARYPDPPRAMEMDSSATRAPQASASPMAGSTCCTHSRWVCLEAKRSSIQTQSCFNSRICCIWYAPQLITDLQWFTRN